MSWRNPHRPSWMATTQRSRAVEHDLANSGCVMAESLGFNSITADSIRLSLWLDERIECDRERKDLPRATDKGIHYIDRGVRDGQISFGYNHRIQEKWIKLMESLREKGPDYRLLIAARRLYEEEDSARTFDQELQALHKNPTGYFRHDSEVLVLARPVRRNTNYEFLTNPKYVFETGDCLWIHCLVGSIKAAWKYLPKGRFAWIGWERNNKPRFFRLRRS